MKCIFLVDALKHWLYFNMVAVTAITDPHADATAVVDKSSQATISTFI